MFHDRRRSQDDCACSLCHSIGHPGRKVGREGGRERRKKREHYLSSIVSQFLATAQSHLRDT